MSANLRSKALKAIEDKGILLVFPIQNRKEPESLWSILYPRSKMRWEWTEEGDSDQRVATLWHLRAELATSNKVVYTKWYQGRATLFSRSIFVAMSALIHYKAPKLGKPSIRLLDFLEETSPQSTKELKRRFSQGGHAGFDAAAKELWKRLLIVGYGEVDDGAFPSLAVGATSVLFEDLFKKSVAMTKAKFESELETKLSPESPFLKLGKKISTQWTSDSLSKQKKIIRYEDLT